METLASWIHQKGPLPPRDAVGWAVRLARHLESLHQHGVAHGNISPACLLIENGSPLSRGAVADVRRTGEMVQYHSPERLRGGQLSPTDDAWAVGALLFTALTRARPYGEERGEIEQRLRGGLPPLAAFGIDDQHLSQLLAATLSPNPSQRIHQVSVLRAELERWFNDPATVARLAPLEDDESSEDDSAATAMVPVGEMVFDEPGSKNPDSRELFAPPSFPRSSPGAPSAPRPMPAPPRSQPQPPAPPPPSPLGEQDATVMRELPAHIMALAARAVAGSNPPPAPDPEPEQDPEDAGGATRIAPAVDLAAVLQASRAPSPPTPPPVPSRPGAPPSGPRPAPPRALRSTQLGVGAPTLASPGALAPRPGFAPPPQTVSSAPPPPGATDDDVRTVMHDMNAGAFIAQATRGAAGAPQMPPQFPQPSFPAPSANPRPAPPLPTADVPDDEDDEDDGGRTMMRESPGVSDAMGAGRPQGAPPQAWAPAAPPQRAFSGVSQTDRPPGFPQGNPQGGPSPQGGAPGVSALLQEALDSMGGPNPAPPGGGPQQGGAPMGAPPGFPPPFEPTGGFGGGSPMGSPPMGAPMGQVAGPFQPLGLGGAQAPFTPAGGSALQGGPMLGDPQYGGYPDPNQAGLMAPASADAPMGYPVGQAASQPLPALEPKKGSKVGLVIVCLLVLVLAATVTFVALRFRAQLGF